jgi:6-phosphofructokinase 1
VRGFVHAARRLSIDVVGSRYGFEGLLDPQGLTPLSIEHVRGILPKGGCVLGCSTRLNPFFVVTGDGNTSDMGPAIVDRLRSSAIDALVLIGGDGTMVAAERFMRLGMPTIGVPKTIDDDLAGTHRTCGFDTAVENATHAIDALHSTAEAHARVMIVEVMGRHAGAIALHSGVAGGADVVLLPEIPYRVERVIAKIREREALGMRFSIIVVAEGAIPAGGDLPMLEAGRAGHLPRLGGAGARLLHDLEAAGIGHEIRLTVLGHVLRGGSPSAADRNLGTLVGTYAAELCHRKAFGQRIVVSDGEVATIPLASEATLHKRVDVRGPLANAARLVGIELGDEVG